MPNDVHPQTQKLVNICLINLIQKYLQNLFLNIKNNFGNVTREITNYLVDNWQTQKNPEFKTIVFHTW